MRSYVTGGGRLLVSYFSGIVDENDAVHDGAYPGAIADVLGIRIEEFLPFYADQVATLDDGSTATTGRLTSRSPLPAPSSSRTAPTRACSSFRPAPCAS